MTAASLRHEVDALIAQAKRIRERLDEEVAADVSPPPAWMTIEDYARRRGVSRSTIYRWIKLGMPVSKRGRVVRVDVEGADAWNEPEAIERNAEVVAARGTR